MANSTLPSPSLSSKKKRALSQDQEAGLQAFHVQSLWKVPTERASFSPDLPRAKQAGKSKAWRE